MAMQWWLLGGRADVCSPEKEKTTAEGVETANGAGEEGDGGFHGGSGRKEAAVERSKEGCGCRRWREWKRAVQGRRSKGCKGWPDVGKMVAETAGCGGGSWRSDGEDSGLFAGRKKLRPRWKRAADSAWWSPEMETKVAPAVGNKGADGGGGDEAGGGSCCEDETGKRCGKERKKTIQCSKNCAALRFVLSFKIRYPAHLKSDLNAVCAVGTHSSSSSCWCSYFIQNTAQKYQFN